jgi:hypothetical protein
MGTCCVAQSKQEQAEFKDQDDHADPTNLAKYSKDDIKKVKQIQSCYRKHRTKNKEEPVEESSKPPPAVATPAESGANSGENMRVKELEAKLGPFKHEDPADDGVQRVTRPETVLDNGAKYEGQWYPGCRGLGTSTPTSATATESRSGLMAASTRASGATTRPTERAG